MTASPPDRLPLPPSGSPHRPPKRSRRRRWARTAARLGAELVVVFVGVYGAFLLSEYREARQADRREAQIYQTLHRYFSELDDELSTATAMVDSLVVTPFMAAYEAGERPRPVILPGGSSGIDTGMWEAMLQAGGLDVLDPAFVYEVESYFSYARFVINQFDRFSAHSDRFLMPRTGEAREVFYADGSDRLDAEFRWYPGALSSLNENFGRLVAHTDSMLVLLEARMDDRGIPLIAEGE